MNVSLRMDLSFVQSALHKYQPPSEIKLKNKQGAALLQTAAHCSCC